MTTSEIRAMSYGGGVQSTAMLVLAARREIDYPLALFCNVGEDSENPHTLTFLHQHAEPYARSMGIELVELRKFRRNGEIESVLGRIHRTEKSIGIPIRLPSGAPGNRTCTVDFKIRLVAKELKRRGATKEIPAICAIGISVDEFQRMRTESGIPHETLAYPLIDLRLTRQDCINIIAREGLPVPPKSSCYFCPFHTKAAWHELRKNEPDLFLKSVSLERFINDRQDKLGRDHVWLTDGARPLDQVITNTGQQSFLDTTDASCDVAGYCMS